MEDGVDPGLRWEVKFVRHFSHTAGDTERSVEPWCQFESSAVRDGRLAVLLQTQVNLLPDLQFPFGTF